MGRNFLGGGGGPQQYMFRKVLSSNCRPIWKLRKRIGVTPSNIYYEIVDLVILISLIISISTYYLDISTYYVDIST